VQGRQVAAWDVVEVTGFAAPSASAAAAMPPPSPVATARLAVPGGEPGELPVLFHDRWMLALDKPPGVLSQPAERRAPGELAMDERAALRLAWEEGRPPFLRLVHRLDRGTSGVLLFARTAAALPPLAEAWRRGAVERRYLALVAGEPAEPSQRVAAPIARVPGGGWRFMVADYGRPATTDVEVLRSGGGRSLVCCRLATGRTHQVRVHLAHLGHPVVGDRLYGSLVEAPRPLLHAASLRLPHPEDGRPLLVEAPLPADFEPVLAGLGDR
jgi:23S rRNA pseudouridine1911/1915/1917 synthase